MSEFKVRECYVCRRMHLSCLDRCNECSSDFDRKMVTCFTILLIVTLCTVAYVASVL